MSHLSKKSTVIIRQANALTTAAYSLTRNEKRLVYIALDGIVNRGIEPNEFGQYPVEMNHQEYSHLFNDDSKNVSRDILAASKSLNKKEVTFYFPEEDGEDGERAHDAMSWTTKRSHRPKRGVTTVFFNAELIKIITKVDKNFTKYLMSQAGRLNNPYAMRLYESLRQWSTRQSVTFSISWMIERYELPLSYSRMSDFRRRFLKPSVKEINELTNMKLEYEELPDRSRANRIASIKFIYEIEGEEDGRDKSAPEAPGEALGYEEAVTTYTEVMDGTRLPTVPELDNLKARLGELLVNGANLDDSFLERFKLAVELSKGVTD